MKRKKQFIPLTPILFNRRWYQPCRVEHVMGFCSAEEHEEFLLSVPKCEEMLIRSGINLLKYYLDVLTCRRNR